MTLEYRTQAIRRAAHEVGFSKVGFAAAGAISTRELFDQWIRSGYHGQMQWMERRLETRVDPRELLPNARSVISLALNYYTPFEQHATCGKISRYAWGDDYHDVVKVKAHELLERIKILVPGVQGLCGVDTAHIAEKYWAVQAGLGWQGKHTNVITRDYGSWVFLGEVIVDVDLEYDQPMSDHCGTCDRCITACPTQAIVQPYVVDSNKCISYLTIEYRGDQLNLPQNLFDNWIYGCDICQDVCPWNRKFSKPSGESRFEPRPGNVNQSLEDLATMTEEQFAKCFKNSAVKRTKFSGLKRNIFHLRKESK